MKKYFYDLHIHSCLSPCGDDDSTPASIAGMGAVTKLDVMALTDHNTARNCPAFFEACRFYGIVPIAGMELTTSEDIHTVCLFRNLEEAMSFNDYIDTCRIKIKNKTEIFGNQLIMNSNDEITGTDEYLLPPATSVSIEEISSIVKKYSGICYPAHIDRESNGIIAVLGTFPEHLDFKAAEMRDKIKLDEYKKKYPALGKKQFVFSSDAHHLWDINEAVNCFELECEEDEQSVIDAIFNKLEQVI